MTGDRVNRQQASVSERRRTGKNLLARIFHQQRNSFSPNELPNSNPRNRITRVPCPRRDELDALLHSAANEPSGSAGCSPKAGIEAP
jgi:hypothetical protein